MTHRIPVLLLFAFLVSCSDNDTQTQILNYPDDRYIVVLNSDEVNFRAANKSVDRQHVVQTVAADISKKYNLGPAEQIYSHVLDGAVYTLRSSRATALAKDPRVVFIEKDHIIQIRSVQSSPPSWGLDRIDQEDLPLDNVYNADSGGAIVNAYIVDTGIRISHEDFQSRAVHGYDLVDKDDDSTDCEGHGTHVAGTVGGTKYGVAKNVKLHGVRVLDCNGSGSYSNVIAGLEWVVKNHVKPAVINMSLGGPPALTIDNAVDAAVQAGITVVVAAGNSNLNACNSSPARVASAITVGSVTNSDVRSSFSNYGSCLDVYAPGSDIKSLGISSDTSTATHSGTSMASPHVAGVAALYLSKYPEASPEEVRARIVNGAVAGKISDAGSGSPNLLLNTSFVPSGGPVPSPSPLPSPSPTPTPTPAPSPTPTPQPLPTPLPPGHLANGVAVTNLSGNRNAERHFTVVVPPNVSTLTIEIYGGKGDADLYVRKYFVPTTSQYTCRPYKDGNKESCKLTSLVPGEWRILVKGYSSFSGVSLKASF